MEQLRLAGRNQERLQWLVTRCGTGAHLVPDSILVAHDLILHHPTAYQAGITNQVVNDAINWLWAGSCLYGLTAAAAAAAAAAADQCRHCGSDRPLRALYLSRSGSGAEGLSDLLVGRGGTSDHDVMVRFNGHFRWAAVADEEPECISPEAAPQLWAKPTDSPGFVTLHWVRTTQCSHTAPLAALPPSSLRQLMWQHCRVWSAHDAEITRSGPAVNIRPADATDGGVDLVPCLRVRWWPERKVFLGRHRVTDFPTAAARRDLCRFGVHLVPTGRPGSDTEQTEYRVSFSRAEVVVVRQLSPTQHATIKVVKEMKNLLKDSGVASALKSYHVKTAVLWLTQDQPSGSWTGVTAGVQMVLGLAGASSHCRPRALLFLGHHQLAGGTQHRRGRCHDQHRQADEETRHSSDDGLL